MIRPGRQVADTLTMILDVGGRLDRDGDTITVSVPASMPEADYDRICQTIQRHKAAFLRLLGPARLPNTKR